MKFCFALTSLAWPAVFILTTAHAHEEEATSPVVVSQHRQLWEKTLSDADAEFLCAYQLEYNNNDHRGEFYTYFSGRLSFKNDMRNDGYFCPGADNCKTINKKGGKLTSTVPEGYHTLKFKNNMSVDAHRKKFEVKLTDKVDYDRIMCIKKQDDTSYDVSNMDIGYVGDDNTWLRCPAGKSDCKVRFMKYNSGTIWLNYGAKPMARRALRGIEGNANSALALLDHPDAAEIMANQTRRSLTTVNARNPDVEAAKRICYDQTRDDGRGELYVYLHGKVKFTNSLRKDAGLYKDMKRANHRNIDTGGDSTEYTQSGGSHYSLKLRTNLGGYSPTTFWITPGQAANGNKFVVCMDDEDGEKVTGKYTDSHPQWYTSKDFKGGPVANGVKWYHCDANHEDCVVRVTITDKRTHWWNWNSDVA